MMNDDNVDAIYEFGKSVVISARDRTIRGIIQLLNGEARDSLGKFLFEEIEKKDFSREILYALLLDCVDNTINDLLWSFEQNEGKYKILTSNYKGREFDIVAGSDGLCVGQWEFIDEFSQYNTADEFLETGELEKVQEGSK